MKKHLLLIVALLISVSLTSRAQTSSSTEISTATRPLVHMFGVEVQNHFGEAAVKFSANDIQRTANAGLVLNAFYERGQLFRIRGEAGVGTYSFPETATEAASNMLGYHAEAMVGYPFCAFKERTYILGYYGVGIIKAPEYKVVPRMLFDFRLSHYLTGKIALNLTLRSDFFNDFLTGDKEKAKAKKDPEMCIALGAGISFML